MSLCNAVHNGSYLPGSISLGNKAQDWFYAVLISHPTKYNAFWNIGIRMMWGHWVIHLKIIQCYNPKYPSNGLLENLIFSSSQFSGSWTKRASFNGLNFKECITNDGQVAEAVGTKRYSYSKCGSLGHFDSKQPSIVTRLVTKPNLQLTYLIVFDYKLPSLEFFVLHRGVALQVTLIASRPGEKYLHCLNSYSVLCCSLITYGGSLCYIPNA